MTCKAIEPELIGYHFGTLDDEARRSVEAHLVECAACVRAFVEIKRGIEASEAPSAAARTRLRGAVARELGIETKRTWWERPVALALAVAVVLVAGATMHELTRGSGDAPYALRR